MQVFRERIPEKNRIIEISVSKSIEMDAVNEKLAIIDSRARFLPLDDCELDRY